MGASDFLRDVAKLCNDCAQADLNKLLGLGARPADPAGAALWDQIDTRLRGQIQSLTGLAPKLAAESVLLGLNQLQADFDSLTQITTDAQQRIARIQEVSELLSTIGRVLDLGLAILALAASPSVAAAEAVLTAAQNVKSGDKKGKDEQ